MRAEGEQGAQGISHDADRVSNTVVPPKGRHGVCLQAQTGCVYGVSLLSMAGRADVSYLSCPKLSGHAQVTEASSGARGRSG